MRRNTVLIKRGNFNWRLSSRVALYLCLETPSVTARNTNSMEQTSHTQQSMQCHSHLPCSVWVREHVLVLWLQKMCATECVPVLSDNNKGRVGETARRAWVCQRMRVSKKSVAGQCVCVGQWPLLVWSAMHEKCMQIRLCHILPQWTQETENSHKTQGPSSNLLC